MNDLAPPDVETQVIDVELSEEGLTDLIANLPDGSLSRRQQRKAAKNLFEMLQANDGDDDGYDWSKLKAIYQYPVMYTVAGADKVWGATKASGRATRRAYRAARREVRKVLSKMNNKLGEFLYKHPTFTNCVAWVMVAMGYAALFAIAYVTALLIIIGVLSLFGLLFV